MLNQIIRRVLMSLINRGVNEGMSRFASKGQAGTGGRAQGAAPQTEAERMQQKQAKDAQKRTRDLARLTRRMR